MRKLALISTFFFLAVAVIACQSQKKELENNLTVKDNGVFGCDTKIYEDEEENVMYLFFKSANDGGLIRMSNADGTPKLSTSSSDETIKLMDDENFDSYSRIYEDTEENVMYLYCKNEYSDDIEVMKNSDGALKLSSNSDYETIDIKNLNRFKGYFKIYEDTEENVMYLFFKAGYNSKIMVMPSKDGTPKLSNCTKYETIDMKKPGILDGTLNVYVDPEEDVMYLYCKNGRDSGAVMMVTSEGLPKKSKDSSYKTTTIEASKQVYVNEKTSKMYLTLKVENSGEIIEMKNTNGNPKTIQNSKYEAKNINELFESGGTSKICIDEENGVNYLFYKDGYDGNIISMTN